MSHNEISVDNISRLNIYFENNWFGINFMVYSISVSNLLLNRCRLDGLYTCLIVQIGVQWVSLTIKDIAQCNHGWIICYIWVVVEVVITWGINYWYLISIGIEYTHEINGSIKTTVSSILILFCVCLCQWHQPDKENLFWGPRMTTSTNFCMNLKAFAYFTNSVLIS